MSAGQDSIDLDLDNVKVSGNDNDNSNIKKEDTDAEVVDSLLDKDTANISTIDLEKESNESNADEDEDFASPAIVKVEDDEPAVKKEITFEGEDDVEDDDFMSSAVESTSVATGTASVKVEDVDNDMQADDAPTDDVKPEIKKDNDDNGLLDEDDDDEEDDDEDEDDDDDDDEVSRKRKKRRAGNQFLDVEAEVDDDEEEEEDEEDEILRQEFLADDQHIEGVENEASRSHRKLDRSREKLDEQDAQALADQFKARYGRSASARYMGSTQNISQRLLLPSVEDPLIWGVRVRNGKEKDLVKQIYARLLNMKGTQEVFSVFQRDNFQGYIYIEARRMDAVNHILSNLPGIYNNVGKVLVPIEEYPDLLRPGRSHEERLKPGSYVRVKTGKYKGDLGIVDNLAENDLEVRVKLVPRLDYGKSANIIDPATGKKRNVGFNSAKFRPAQRLFSEIEAQQYDFEHLTTAKRDRNYYIYKNEEYINGFLYKDIKYTQLETQNVMPSLQELTLFDSMKESEGIDLQSVAATLKNADSNVISFQPNDRVEIISGEQSKMKGRVLSIAEAKIARVLLEGNESDTEVNSTIVEVPTTSLRKVFLPGDHVTIIHGVHKDESGLIVGIKDNQVTLVSDQTKKDITVFPNYLVTSVDSSTTSSKIGRFELHQMVHLNSHKIGMIIKVEKEVFTILCTDGRVLTLEPRNIMSALDVNRMTEKTTDRNGLEIKVGDVVREANGEKRQGNIMHIYKSFLFLHSKTVYENTGIFVTDSNSVQTIANKGSIVSAFKVPDLNKMNPNRVMAPPSVSVVNQSRFGGRDITISQHVSVRKGPYKGKKGIIKDANGDVARVEMHNPAKIIPINKSDLLFELRPGSYVPHEQFLENYRGRNSNNNRGGHGPSLHRPPQQQFPGQGLPGAPQAGYGGRSAYGSYNSGPQGMNPAFRGGPPGNPIASGSGVTGGKTPSWSSGGKTPGWDASNGNMGGKTPSWSGSGGKTPAWGSQAGGTGGKTPAWGSGGKTPSWSASGSKTPAWGDNSGGKTPSWSASGGNRSVWGGDKTEYGGNSGNRSTWGGASTYRSDANSGNTGNGPDWGATPSVGEWDAPTPSGVKKEEED